MKLLGFFISMHENQSNKFPDLHFSSTALSAVWCFKVVSNLFTVRERQRKFWKFWVSKNTDGGKMC